MKSENHHITLLSITGFLLILFLLIKSIYIIYAALSIILITFIFPGSAKYITGFFTFILKTAGKINMYLFSSLFFYVFLFPIGMIFQAGGKKFPVRKDRKVSRESYFTERIKTFGAKDLENPW